MATENEVKAWYDVKYRSHGKKTMRPREAYSIFLEYLGVEPGKKLLDVGCGTGMLLSAAAERGVEAFGTDVSEEAVRIAREVSPSSRIEIGKGEKLEFEDAFFDYVACLGSLEHFLDMSAALQEMRRTAKSDARFCVMVPNADYLFWSIPGKRGTEQQAIQETLLSMAEWKALFSRNGFAVLNIFRDDWYARMPLFSSPNPLAIGKKIFYKVIWRLIPLARTYQFVFILAKS